MDDQTVNTMDDQTFVQLTAKNESSKPVSTEIERVAFDLRSHLEERRAQIDSNHEHTAQQIADLYDPLDQICDRLIASLTSVKRSCELLREEEKRLAAERRKAEFDLLEQHKTKLQSIADVINAADAHGRKLGDVLLERMNSVAEEGKV